MLWILIVYLFIFLASFLERSIISLMSSCWSFVVMKNSWGGYLIKWTICEVFSLAVLRIISLYYVALRYYFRSLFLTYDFYTSSFEIISERC